MNHTKRLMLAAVAVVVVATAALATMSVAYAQNGHFLTGGNNAPGCTDIGTQVNCTGSVAGLGGTTFEVTVEADGIADVVCINPGGNRAPGQDTVVTVEGTTDPLPTTKNGRYNFAIVTGAPHVPSTPTCPNPKWTAEVVGVTFTTATLSLYEDGVLVDHVIVAVN